MVMLMMMMPMFMRIEKSYICTYYTHVCIMYVCMYATTGLYAVLYMRVVKCTPPSCQRHTKVRPNSLDGDSLAARWVDASTGYEDEVRLSTCRGGD